MKCVCYRGRRGVVLALDMLLWHGGGLDWALNTSHRGVLRGSPGRGLSSHEGLVINVDMGDRHGHCWTAT